MNHDVDALVSAARSSGEVTIPDGWDQGRATFGGIIAGALVSRALGELDLPDETLRSVTINFVAPTAAGPVSLETTVLRQGRSASQVEVRLWQADGGQDPTVRAIALLTFGAPRASAVEVLPDSVTSAGDFAALESVPFIAGMTPDFIQNVDLRVAEGGLPFSGSHTGDLRGFMRFRELTSEFGVAHLITLIDGWPPASAQLLSQPAALSTMTWTVELVAPVSADPATIWSYDVVTDAAHEGYAHTGAQIGDGSGRLVALSRQTVAIFG